MKYKLLLVTSLFTLISFSSFAKHDLNEFNFKSQSVARIASKKPLTDLKSKISKTSRIKKRNVRQKLNQKSAPKISKSSRGLKTSTNDERNDSFIKNPKPKRTPEVWGSINTSQMIAEAVGSILPRGLKGSDSIRFQSLPDKELSVIIKRENDLLDKNETHQFFIKRTKGPWTGLSKSKFYDLLGFKPNKRGVYPNLYGDYPDINGNYPDENGYYPRNGNYPDENGYYPRNGNYPDENGYYPRNGNYPDENGHYPRNGNYPDENGAYPDANGNYPSTNIKHPNKKGKQSEVKTYIFEYQKNGEIAYFDDKSIKSIVKEDFVQQFLKKNNVPSLISSTTTNIPKFMGKFIFDEKEIIIRKK